MTAQKNNRLKSEKSLAAPGRALRSAASGSSSERKALLSSEASEAAMAESIVEPTVVPNVSPTSAKNMRVVDTAKCPHFLLAEGFSTNSHTLLLLYCLSAALSIAAAQLILGALIAYWLLYRVVATGKNFSLESSSSIGRGSWAYLERLGLNSAVELQAPILSWFLLNLLASPFGISPWHSLSETFKAGIFLLLPFTVFETFSAIRLSTREFLSRIETYVAALILGQCLAALHTVISEGLDYELPALIPGAVTESGQLVLILPMLLAGAYYALCSSSFRDELSITILGRQFPPALYGALFFMALLVVAWPGAILWDDSTIGIMLGRMVALFVALLLALPPLFRGGPAIKEKFWSKTFSVNGNFFQLVWPATALLFAALLINLKRGPWMGVFVELLILGFFLSRRLLFWSVLLTFGLLLTLSPARSRVESLDEHFEINGGRKVMWELGMELAERYPLGLGQGNAQYMRKLDPSIPPSHRHMHNNFLNVLTENGWLGLVIYFWWMYAILSCGLRIWRASLVARDRLTKQLGLVALCLTVSLFGWQISGLVEYNFGDGEIRLIAFFFMGLLLALQRMLPGNGSVSEGVA